MTTQTSSSETNSASVSQKGIRRMPLHICVCICKFRRRELLARLLARLHELQKGADLFTLSCVVIDNDENGSAAEVVSSFENSGKIKCIYWCEPEPNFAVVRNRAVQAAKGD